MIPESVDLDRVLEIILQSLAAWKVRTGAVRLLNGAYLRKHGLMDRHYGVLNVICRKGREAISATAEATLREQFGDWLDRGAEVLGGYQFLDQYPQFTPHALSTLSDNLGIHKMAGGTYVIPVNAQGRLLLVLNAFHPFQLEPYYDAANTIVLIEGRSATPWADLRVKLAGATNPADAAEGSIRNRFLVNQEALGLPNVSPGANGIHLSAGPLEGMVELQRFFSDHESEAHLDLDQTLLGRLLQQRGATGEELTRLASNPDLETPEGTQSAFDLTEEKNADESADLLIPFLRNS